MVEGWRFDSAPHLPGRKVGRVVRDSDGSELGAGSVISHTFFLVPRRRGTSYVTSWPGARHGDYSWFDYCRLPDSTKI